MRFLLHHPDRDPVRGDTLRDVVFQVASIDRVRRCAVVDGAYDTVTIGPDYSDDELTGEVAQRALVMLERRGWSFYVLYDRRFG